MVLFRSQESSRVSSRLDLVRPTLSTPRMQTSIDSRIRATQHINRCWYDGEIAFCRRYPSAIAFAHSANIPEFLWLPA